MDDIKAVLIDIDDTLLDFNACATVALKKCFIELGLPYEDDYFKVFLQINNALWAKIGTGEITQKEHRAMRFKLIFDKLNINYDVEKCESTFRDKLYQTAVPVDGAFQLLEYLYEKYDLYAASNAYSRQHERMRISGLDKYFKKVFLSEDLGATKPTKEYFDKCFSYMGGVLNNQAIMIGDSLTADIEGGKNYGLKTIWFNPKDKPENPNIKPDYIVKSLSEIKNIL